MKKMLRRLLKFFAGPDERDKLVARIGFQVVNDADAMVLRALKNILKRLPEEPAREDKREIVRSFRFLIAMESSSYLQEYEDCWRMVVQPLKDKPVVEVFVSGLEKTVWLIVSSYYGAEKRDFQIGFIC